MVIKGFQKLTLLDYPEKVACTLFTSGCNFRCPFCHNASLVTHTDDARISEEEIFAYLNKRKGVLDGVCLTGGEPLIQHGVAEFLAKIKAMGLSVKLDTNGSFPKTLISLVKAGLVDYVAMDIKNSPEHYAKTAGVEDFDMTPIYESVNFLMSGAVPYEFRTTVVKELHSAEDFVAISKWLAGAEKYFLQGFVDSGDLISQGLSAYSAEELQAFAEILAKTVKNVRVR